MTDTYPATIAASPASALDHLRHYAAIDLTEGRRVLYVTSSHETGRRELDAITTILGEPQIFSRTISSGNLTLDTTTGGRLWVYSARGSGYRGLAVDTLIFSCQLTEQQRIDLTPTLNASSSPHWYQVEQAESVDPVINVSDMSGGDFSRGLVTVAVKVPRADAEAAIEAINAAVKEALQ